MAESNSMQCPMAKACQGMAGGKRSSGAFGVIILAGLLFVAVGVLIIFVPEALVWLMAAASILLGAMMLLMAMFLRRIGARLKNEQG